MLENPVEHIASYSSVSWSSSTLSYTLPQPSSSPQYPSSILVKYIKMDDDDLAALLRSTQPQSQSALPSFSQPPPSDDPFANPFANPFSSSSSSTAGVGFGAEVVDSNPFAASRSGVGFEGDGDDGSPYVTQLQREGIIDRDNEGAGGFGGGSGYGATGSGGGFGNGGFGGDDGKSWFLLRYMSK